MGRIISLDGKLQAGTPEAVVAIVREVAALADDGNIAAIAIAAVTNDGRLYSGQNTGGSWSRLLAAVEALKFDMLMEAERD